MQRWRSWDSVGSGSRSAVDRNLARNFNVVLEDDVSKFDELRSEYIEYKQAIRNFINENEALTRLITFGFKHYIGLPDEYKIPLDPEGKSGSYMKFFEVDPDDQDFRNEVENFREAITHNMSDRSFSFGYGVVLDRREGSFPKEVFIFNFDCRRDGDRVTLKIFDHEAVAIHFDGEASSDINVLHQHMHELLIKWFKRRPGDGAGPVRFGFQVG